MKYKFANYAYQSVSIVFCQLGKPKKVKWENMSSRLKLGALRLGSSQKGKIFNENTKIFNPIIAKIDVYEQRMSFILCF